MTSAEVPQPASVSTATAASDTEPVIPTSPLPANQRTLVAENPVPNAPTGPSSFPKVASKVLTEGLLAINAPEPYTAATNAEAIPDHTPSPGAMPSELEKVADAHSSGCSSINANVITENDSHPGQMASHDMAARLDKPNADNLNEPAALSDSPASVASADAADAAALSGDRDVPVSESVSADDTPEAAGMVEPTTPSVIKTEATGLAAPIATSMQHLQHEGISEPFPSGTSAAGPSCPHVAEMSPPEIPTEAPFLRAKQLKEAVSESKGVRNDSSK